MMSLFACSCCCTLSPPGGPCRGRVDTFTANSIPACNSSITMTDLRAQLAEKVVAEVNNGHSYEALQLMQSFIARKKKLLGRKETSAMVFYGAGLLVDNGAPADAGTLLVWFIEDGAGDDFNFHMEETPWRLGPGRSRVGGHRPERTSRCTETGSSG